VNFALAGLGSSKNPKYDTAVQLYNLERDSGKIFTLEDLEKKFFAIDEKSSREAVKTRIAQGNVAMGQRGERGTYRSRNLRNPRRNGHRRTADANAALDSNNFNRHANTTCYYCGKKGHVVPNCPDKKNGKPRSNKPAQGNVARDTSKAAEDGNSPELVCLAQEIILPPVRPPRRSGPEPAVTVDFHAREFGSTEVFVSLVVRVDEATFSGERERSFQRGHLPELHTGDLRPLEEPLWVLLHNRPFRDLDTRFARVLRPNHHARFVFINGIIPGLERGFNVKPEHLPLCYRYWHSLVKAYLEYRLKNIEQALNLPVTVGLRHKTMVITFYPISYHTPEVIMRDQLEYIVHLEDSDEEWEVEQTFMAISQSEKANAIKKRDPSISEIGDPADLNNYLPDSGATQHMTPRLADLSDTVEGQNLGVEVADGHVIKCTITGKIQVKMLDDNGERLDVTLTDVMYVPGLSRRLFSVAKFARHGFHAMIKRNATTLYFHSNGRESPITLASVGGGKALAADLRVQGNSSDVTTSGSSERYHTIPCMRNRDHSAGARKLLSLEMLHNRLGHRRCRTLLAASEHGLWADAGVLMSAEVGCLDCGIATIRAAARNKYSHTAATRAGEHLFLDIQYAVLPQGLTRATTFPNYLLIVDGYSRYTRLYGLQDKSSATVIEALKKFQAEHSCLTEIGHLDTEKIRADAGTEFDSGLFSQHCINAGIKLVLAAPKKQCQNHLAERTWQTVCNIARSLLVHARLPDIFWFQAICYAAQIFNVLPVRGLKNQEEIPSTPHEMFFGAKPCILPFRVFGCPCIIKRWVAEERSQGKQTERGMRGIFIGFDTNRKGFLFYMPGSRNIINSGDATFDETFYSAIATTWQQHRDTLALQPTHSYIPDITTTLEHTGTLADIKETFEEGEQVKVDEQNMAEDNLEAVERFEEREDLEEGEIHNAYPIHNDSEFTDLPDPLIVDASNNEPDARLRRSKRTPKPNPRYANVASIVGWANTCRDLDLELVEACAAEAHTDIRPNTGDATSWEPAPKTIRDILKMKDGIVRQEWLKAIKKELKTLIESGTFAQDTRRDGEISTPVMETFKVKVKSDGALDKLKCRLVVRGDLQDKNITEDKWSPTASFRSLKMFLAHASRTKARVKQLDFVGAFLQAKMRTRMFVTIPQIYGILFPEYKGYCGVPVRLVMSMYGTTLCGKYWYMDLTEYMLEVGFKPSECMRCLFIRTYADGTKMYVLNYVDDMLYHCRDTEKLIEFEQKLRARFNLELIGQAHWYLGTRINQLANYDIELDQSRYCAAIVKKYLDAAGAPKVDRVHNTPLPLDFVPTSDDCSASEEAVKLLEQEYNIDFASCVGSLIYLGMTRCDIVYATNKLAKFTRLPGRVHFDVLLHLLRYLRDNALLGIRFYSDLFRAPLMKMLESQKIQQHHAFFGFSDSSWNDDADTGRSTGCFILTYMGGIVDHSSNTPDPVALSSAEAEYNEGCVAFMAASHLRMLLCELEGIEETNMAPTTMLFDSKSAIAMGISYRDTKHTRHIMRRYHYVRNEIVAKRFVMQWISTEFMISDIGTKQTPGPRHTFLVELIHIKVKDQRSLIQEG
jgi:transposase InsO family protein